MLRVRALQEEIARAAWLEVERAAASAEARTELGARAVRTERADLGRRMEDGAISPVQVLSAHAAIDGMHAHTRGWRERAKTLRFQAQQARAPWEERRRDVQALEKLRERARAAEAREEFSEEAATLDEVAQRRASRSGTEPTLRAPAPGVQMQDRT